MIFGALAVWMIVFVLGNFGYSLHGVFSLDIFLIATLFALVVGMVFGLAPAYRASELSPIEALRRD
jgi:putative ABC transport system permease protein